MADKTRQGAGTDDFQGFVGLVHSVLAASGIGMAPCGVDGFPAAIGGVGNLDREIGSVGSLTHGERDLLQRVEEQVEVGDYALPHLRRTHAALVDLVTGGASDLAEVERLVATDVALTALLLRLANSSRSPGDAAIASVRTAVAHVGLHGLRSLVLTLSLKDVIFRPPWLADCATELWRQATSVALTARELAVPLCLDPERTFVLGLLHDVGKIPLIRIMREVAKTTDVRTSVIGFILHRFHERVGRRLARAWHLSDEIASVAGCHHEFAANVEFPQSAALVHLAHQLDLCLSTGDATAYFELERSRAIERLDLPVALRRALLDACRDSYQVTRVENRGRGLGLGPWHRRSVAYDPRHAEQQTPLPGSS